MKFLSFLLLLLLGCQEPGFVYKGTKKKGISLVASPQPIGSEVMQELEDVGAEWVCLMPYAFGRMGDTTLQFNLERQWWGERDEGLIASIRLAQVQGLHIMLKPHLWLRGGGFTGDLTFETEQQWQAWERAYTRYMLHHARLADSLQLPLLCIGTELSEHNRQRPQYWQQLIDTVRQVYEGQLTYAANWDAVDDFPHWEQLDFIGVDAYFPLSEATAPSVAEVAKAWLPHLKPLAALAGKHQKPILFTEWGYRSIRAATHEPWVFHQQAEPDASAQALAYRALLETVWPQPWFAGGFLWKWYPPQPEMHEGMATDYSPQGKPAQQVLKEFYTRP